MNEQPDYNKMAQGMLQMWQDHWKSLTTAMTQTAPQATRTADAASETKPASAWPYQQQMQTPPQPETPSAAGADFTVAATEGMEQWQRFMTSWAEQTKPAAAKAETSAPTQPEAKASEAKAEEPAHVPQPEPKQQQEANRRQPQAAAASARAAPESRDVLLAELSRRVEFLHDRCIKLESELEKLKRRI